MMAKRSITIRLSEKGSHLDVSTLITALQDTVAVLKGIDQAVTGERSPVLHWYISHIQMNSPLEATLECERVRPKRDKDGPLPEVIRPFLRGMKQIDKKAQSPRYFGESELTRIKRVVDLQKNGVAFIEFFSKRDDVVRPTINASDHIDVLLGGGPVRPYTQFAELEGRLEDISLHPDVPQFAIYDPLTDQPIGCNFDEKDIDRVMGLLKRKARVRVYGDAKYNSKHYAVLINVQGIEELPEQNQLPQIDDLHEAEIDLTNGNDPVEIVRGLRNGR